MLELLHMTAQYSNAVIVAALPYVSDFAGRLNLPIKQPVTVHEVARAGVVPYKDHADVGIWLTSKYWFHVNYSGGMVDSFRGPTNFFYEQEADVSSYAGQDHMTTNDAIAMARKALNTLGYKPNLSHSYETPSLEGPADTSQGHMPYCRVRWQWPKGENVSPMLLHYIKVDINTEAKTLVGFEVFFCGTNIVPSAPIHVSVEPELEKDYQKRIHPNMLFDTNGHPILWSNEKD